MSGYNSRIPLLKVKLLVVLLTVTMTTGFSDQDFNNADTQDKVDTGCGPGRVVNLDDTCQTCYAGLYADHSIQQCLECPLNTYSDGEANSDCTQCPWDKRTTDVGTRSVDNCVDVCEIPATINSYYQKVETNELLEADRRVVAGDQIILQCIDDEHKVLKTEFSHLIVRCTATFKTITLPNTCVRSNEPAEDELSGLICYDSCYKETSNGKTRFVKLVGGGTVIIESCPLAECRADEDTCVSVTYTDTFRDMERTHFSCQESSNFDPEICTSSGAAEDELEGCKVDRCDTERCNDPDLIEKTSSSDRTSAKAIVVLTVVMITLSYL
ncbi:hypothetical protein ACHWQZ_G000139 [Mnemiopsis leidyi]